MNKVIEYVIEYECYRLKVLNLGATITEYSIDGHNIVLNYANKEDYKTNELFAGSIIGRTAGRIENADAGTFKVPTNYNAIHNHHGAGLHLKYYDVEIVGNSIICKLFDAEGDYPGNAKIEVIYSLGDNGLTQEIKATSDKPTLFNFTNHSYFNLEMGNKVLEHSLQIDCRQYAHLDNGMFVEDIKDVHGTAFDFNKKRSIGSSFDLEDNGQFAITKFIDHPFKLDGCLRYSNSKYMLEVDTDCDYVVIYAANYLGDNTTKLSIIDSFDYGAICFETQKIPGDVNLVDDYYSKTEFKLKKK